MGVWLTSMSLLCLMIEKPDTWVPPSEVPRTCQPSTRWRRRWRNVPSLAAVSTSWIWSSASAARRPSQSEAMAHSNWIPAFVRLWPSPAPERRCESSCNCGYSGELLCGIANSRSPSSGTPRQLANAHVISILLSSGRKCKSASTISVMRGSKRQCGSLGLPDKTSIEKMSLNCVDFSSLTDCSSSELPWCRVPKPYALTQMYTLPSSAVSGSPTSLRFLGSNCSHPGRRMSPASVTCNA